MFRDNAEDSKKSTPMGFGKTLSNDSFSNNQKKSLTFGSSEEKKSLTFGSSERKPLSFGNSSDLKSFSRINSFDTPNAKLGIKSLTGLILEEEKNVETNDFCEEEYQTFSSQKIKEMVRDDKIEIYESKKLSYNYNSSNPRLTNKRKIIDKSISLEKLKDISDTADMMGMDATGIKKESSLQYRLAAKSLKEISSATINTLKLAGKVSFYNIREFLNNVNEIYKELNAEERGRLLVLIIFGGLISRDKVSKTTSIINNVNQRLLSLYNIIKDIKKGFSNKTISPEFTIISDLLKGSKFNDYKSKCQIYEQIDLVIEFVNRISIYEIFIPTDVTIIVGSERIIINGEITYDILTRYFNPNTGISEKPKEIKSTKSKGKIHHEKITDYDDF